jgi:hypothetical protein
MKNRPESAEDSMGKMEKVIQRELKRQHWYAAGCGLGCLLLGGPGGPGMLLFIFAAYFGFTALMAVQKKEFLKMDAEGFTIKSMWEERRERWADIEGFYVVTTRYMLIPIRRMVAYRYAKGYQQSAVRKALRFVNHWDKLLPNNYGMKAKDLAAVLELQKRSAAPPPPTVPTIQVL